MKLFWWGATLPILCFAVVTQSQWSGVDYWCCTVNSWIVGPGSNSQCIWLCVQMRSGNPLPGFHEKENPVVWAARELLCRSRSQSWHPGDRSSVWKSECPYVLVPSVPDLFFFCLNPPKWPQLNRSKQYTADLYSPIPVCISSNTEFQLEALMLYNQVLKTKGAQDILQISIFHLISALLSILQTRIFHQYYFKWPPQYYSFISQL